MAVANGERAEAINEKEVARMVRLSLKRTQEMFVGEDQSLAKDVADEQSQEMRLRHKIRVEYQNVRHMAPPVKPKQAAGKAGAQGKRNLPAIPTDEAADAKPGPATAATTTAKAPVPADDATVTSGVGNILDRITKPDVQASNRQLVAASGAADKGAAKGGAGVKTLSRFREPPKVPAPTWHAPWKLMRVVSGHTGWVRCIAVEPGNQWFATGSVDRVIKIWDLATGKLKLSLTGHISDVRGLAVSERSPYLFSVGADCKAKCWDLEYNKVIRHYHGHLSAVYCCALHPTLDVLLTGGRDSVTRVWDIRTKAPVHVLSGHSNTINTILTFPTDPQVASGSMDSTVRLYDLAAGKCRTTLTHHKKSVRAMVKHHSEWTFASGSPDSIRQWKMPDGDFQQVMRAKLNKGEIPSTLQTMSLNQDNVMMTSGDGGRLNFWDWKSGHCFQSMETQVQPGTLSSENNVYASAFDKSGSRLITCEGDKTIKFYKEDETATEESHPVVWKPELVKRKF